MAKSVEVAKTALQITFQEAAKSMLAESISGDDILIDILNAPTVDDILGSEVVGLEALTGKPFTITKGTLRESDFTDGLAAYIVLNVTFDDGETAVVTSGSTSVVTQVVRMHQLGALPVRCMARKATKPTANGYYPMSLVKAPPALESF